LGAESKITSLGTSFSHLLSGYPVPSEYRQGCLRSAIVESVDIPGCVLANPYLQQAGRSFLSILRENSLMSRICALRFTKWCVMFGFCVTGLPLTVPQAFSQASAQSAVRDRIVQAVNNGQMAILPGSATPLAQSEYDQGRVEPDMAIEGVSIAFSLSPSQQAALQSLLAAQQDPSSPLYHKWLTPDEFAARFGMSDDDLNKAEAWLQSQGFTGLQISRSRAAISFNGSAAQIENAFHTEIHRYQVNGEKHVANSSDLSIPSALGGVVLAVRHLNDFQPKPRARKLTTAHFTSSVSGSHFLTPGDFATIYDIDPLYTAGFDGSGVTIAVIGQTLIDVSDANAFRSAAGLSVNPPQLFLVPGTGNATTCTGDLNEANLDVEWSDGVAKNATILFVYAGVGTAAGSSCTNRNANVFDALEYAIANNLAPVISISYGNCESALGSGFILSLQQEIQQANAQGQTVSAASGDNGAADCDSSTATTATHGLAVDVPAAIPEVTGVGGTEFMDDTTGADPPYWAGASGSDVISSALVYIPEMAWNDSPVTGTGTPPLATTISAGGGGVSTIFTSKPSWQAALTLPDGVRDVPDVALAGSPGHDGYLVCSQGSCVNGFRMSNQDLNVFGGTSVGAQVFGGILAILNQATHSSGLGNANVELYKLAASTPAVIHDITTGNNIVPCKSGTPSCPATAPFQFGYSAKTGYDLATGLGSLDVNNLASAWPGFVAATSYSVSATPITISSAGASAPSTVTVSSSNGFAGTINLACAFVPPQPASAGISCSLNQSSVVLSNSTTSATATLTVSTTAPHAISNTSANKRAPGHWFMVSSGAFLACLFIVGIPARKRSRVTRFGVALLAFLGCALMFSSMGCGGGSSSGGGGTTPTAATPTLNPAPGDYTGHVAVSFSDATTGALLFCTTDGITPTASSPACATLNLTTTSTLQAIAVATGYNNSAVASGTYTIQQGTAMGTYVVQVTAKSGSSSQAANVLVTVQ